IAGTEEAFTSLMNEKATDIGLSDQTTFVNATGLPKDELENKMSAEDVATLAYVLLKDHREVLEMTSLSACRIECRGVQFYSANRALNRRNGDTYSDGVTGLATGFTQAAGYCFVGTAQHDAQPLPSAVINAGSGEPPFIGP